METSSLAIASQTLADFPHNRIGFSYIHFSLLRTDMMVVVFGSRSLILVMSLSTYVNDKASISSNIELMSMLKKLSPLFVGEFCKVD